MIAFIYLFIFVAAAILFSFAIQLVVPFFANVYRRSYTQKTSQIAERLEDSFIFWEKRRLFFLSLAPLLFAGLGFLLLNNPIGLAIGFVFGLGFPSLMAMLAKKHRLKKFQGQFVDSLMILSSSIKAGLSFVQAIEVLCEEMPAPISQEFNLVLKENKMGLSLEESLRRLRKRLPTEEVNLLVSSILVAREAGGELPRVLSRLAETVRNNMKLKEKIATLTLQGRLQGLIMMLLPFVFVIIIYRQNPSHFDVMLETETGRTLLIAAVGLQLVGMYLIKKTSTLRI